jgi:hypothetical protein
VLPTLAAPITSAGLRSPNAGTWFLRFTPARPSKGKPVSDFGTRPLTKRQKGVRRRERIESVIWAPQESFQGPAPPTTVWAQEHGVNRFTRTFCGQEEARLLTFNAQVIDFAGGPEGIRTSDLCLRRAPLYRMVHLTGEAPAFKGVGDKATVIDVPDMPSMPPSALGSRHSHSAVGFLRTLPYVCPGPKLQPSLGRASIIKSLIFLARPKRFELLTPRFVA